MRSIVLCSHKGGTGKTTIGVGLAQWLANMNQRVCMVEADLFGAGLDCILPKAESYRHLSDYLRLRGDRAREETDLSSYLLREFALPRANGECAGRFDVLLAWAGYGGFFAPETGAVEESTEETPAAMHKGSASRTSIVNLLSTYPGLVAGYLQTLWGRLEAEGKYQYCVIDCPPGISPGTIPVLMSLGALEDKFLLLVSNADLPSVQGLVPDVRAMEVERVLPEDMNRVIHVLNRCVSPDDLEEGWARRFGEHGDQLRKEGVTQQVELVYVYDLDMRVAWGRPPDWRLMEELKVERLGQMVSAG